MREGKDERLVAELARTIVAHNGRMTDLGHDFSRHCVRGCARCCAMIFFVSPAETEVIARHLLARPDLLAIFRERSREREERLAPVEGLWNRCQQSRYADDPALREWYQQDIRCALNDSGACIVYPVRPLSCSLYNSLVPPEVCGVEPKCFETAEMRELHASTRRELARMAGRRLPAAGHRLDVSRLVLGRLKELERSDSNCLTP